MAAALQLQRRITGPIASVYQFEAYSSDKEFFAQLDDYVAEDEESSAANSVVVTGTVEAASASTKRLESSAPLLKPER